MDINLDDMSLQELKSLQSRVAKAVSGYVDRKKKQALSDLEETAKKHGYTLSELTGVAGVRKRAPVAPKYANPDDGSQTWSGRGRKPRWMEAALKNGKSLDDLTI